MRFRLDDLVIDTVRLTIERDGVAVRVQPQVFDVLVHLVANRDRVVPKEELLDEVWGDRFVSESALSSRIKSVRQLVGDDGARQAVVQTFHGRGFRWVADIELLESESEESQVAPAPSSRLQPVPPPRPNTETVGRQDSVDELINALASRRVVTLIGSPGIGKTRVALTALERLPERRVAFVELHTATNRADILRLVLHGVGLDRERGVAAAMESTEDDLEHWLLERLGGAPLLLAFDNCEHVAADVARLVPTLLAAGPSLTILATSRRPLWIDGEQLIVVRPLPLPEGATWDELRRSPAVRLLLDRSATAGVSWGSGEDDAEVLARIARRLDGIPLAIELAAARLRWMSPDRLLEDLTDTPGDRPAGSRPLTDSLRASRALLDGPAQAAFDSLSVFAGAFTLDTAFRVISDVCSCDDPLSVFEQLVDHSLIDVVDRTAGRYRLLAPVRQFAASGEPRVEIALRAVLAHWTETIEHTSDRATGPVDVRTALGTDMVDVIGLIERAMPSDPAGCRGLVGAIGFGWWTSDAAGRCVSICERLGEPVDMEDPRATARYLWAWSLCSSLLWQPLPELAERAHRLAAENGQWSLAASALSLTVAGDHVWAELDAVEPVWNEIETLYRRAGDDTGEAWARVKVLGHAQACAGRSADAIASFRTAIELYERVGDRIGMAEAALHLAREAIWVGSDADLAEEALALFPEELAGPQGEGRSSPPELVAEAVWYEGRIAEARGDTERALERHRTALAISAAHTPTSIVTNTMRVHLAGALRRSGALEEAMACLRTALDAVLASTAASRWAHSTWVLENLAGLLAELDRFDGAAILFGAAEGGRERLDAPMPTWDRAGYESDVAMIDPSASTDAAWDMGRQLDLPDACRAALSMCGPPP